MRTQPGESGELSSNNQSITSRSGIDVQEEEDKDLATNDDSLCKLHYEQANGSKRVLFSMCTGLLASDEDPNARKLDNFNVDPYISSKNRKSFNPTRRDLIDEVYRRVRVFGHAAVRADNWAIEISKKWLGKNKITNPADIAFLREEELKFYSTLVRANNERQAAAVTAPPPPGLEQLGVRTTGNPSAVSEEGAGVNGSASMRTNKRQRKSIPENEETTTSNPLNDTLRLIASGFTATAKAATSSSGTSSELVKTKTMAWKRVQNAEEGVYRLLQLAHDATSDSQKVFCEERLARAKEVLADAEDAYRLVKEK